MNITYNNGRHFEKKCERRSQRELLALRCYVPVRAFVYRLLEFEFLFIAFIFYLIFPTNFHLARRLNYDKNENR